MKKVKFLNILIDLISMSDTINLIEKAIVNNYQIHHTVVNAGKIVKMQSDKFLKESVNSADIINVDGQGVVWGMKLLGININERVAGIDLMERLVKKSHEKGYKCFFLGAKDDVLLKLINGYKEKYSDQIIGGYRNGYFDDKEELSVVQQINNSKSNILFVGITSPKKEVFLNKYKLELSNVNFILGVGGSFDVISGKVKRAPIWMQKNGLEWFFRFIQEPKRMWKRYFFGNIKFIWLVLKEYFTRK